MINRNTLAVKGFRANLNGSRVRRPDVDMVDMKVL